MGGGEESVRMDPYYLCTFDILDYARDFDCDPCSIVAEEEPKAPIHNTGQEDVDLDSSEDVSYQISSQDGERRKANSNDEDLQGLSDEEEFLDTLEEELLEAEHRRCGKHIYQAWAKKWRGTERRKNFGLLLSLPLRHAKSKFISYHKPESQVKNAADVTRDLGFKAKSLRWKGKQAISTLQLEKSRIGHMMTRRNTSQ
ncbi:hypothetical protein GH714_017738 [Hevea brasiliensis]|uniref:Uncharacterized protein n=1 Tax=Hevea brasiliensis TaxID=3981 RepID=A0A6A6M8C7_HEVBR|nr:hypothetical protein GH714_017738 [Hevea brasiliensis]